MRKMQWCYLLEVEAAVVKRFVIVVVKNAGPDLVHALPFLLPVQITRHSGGCLISTTPIGSQTDSVLLMRIPSAIDWCLC